jgi:hypothetical protein
VCFGALDIRLGNIHTMSLEPLLGKTRHDLAHPASNVQNPAASAIGPHRVGEFCIKTGVPVRQNIGVGYVIPDMV